MEVMTIPFFSIVTYIQVKQIIKKNENKKIINL